jgi:hypothetical protein
MIESLATIMSDFAGEANRARCLAHIVNLVVKIILRQFDVPKKKEKKDERAPNPDLASGDQVEVQPEIIGDDDDELLRVLDKEEKEMDDTGEADDEDSENLLRDIERIEEAMEEEIKGVSKIAKPVREVLFKVGTMLSYPSVLGLPLFFLASFLTSFFLTFFFWLPLFLAPAFLPHFSCTFFPFVAI